MKASFSQPPQPPIAAGPRRGRRDAFALVVTLLILSLLVVVAVSYLSSMVGERQTADAYSSKARAEQVAQAGVDSAMAILTESFRDFPDSATVWDPQQSVNSDGSFNEGTSLYLRAVSMQGTPGTIANPQPNAGSTDASDAKGNNPNNPACKNFVLPLISGVPYGGARLVSEKASIFPKKADLPTVTDPSKQVSTDLNVRRASGDTQGVIGSPPDWTGTSPKPAKAYWVNMTGTDGKLTGRYAFWIEDESFRTNINYIGNNAVRVDNTAQPTDGSTPAQARSLQPKDMSFAGTLAAFASVFDPNANAQSVLDTRNIYPASYLPEPLAFTHTADGHSLAASVIDGLRYLTTTQSSALNLTRHGTERLNLNATVTNVSPAGGTAATKQIQHEVDQLVKTLQFHLPNLGQRFYRTTPDPQTNTSLNALQVTGALSTDGGAGDPRLIYDYKIAANLRDYLDNDSQPTLVQNGGKVLPYPPPPPDFPQPFGTDGANVIWAQGKEAAPFLQETVVRFRPVNTPGSNKYTLKVDYYLEFWNMSDKDVYAAPQSDPKLPHLNNAVIGITNQQTWLDLNSGQPLTDDSGHPPQNGVSDYAINLTGSVYKSVGGSLVPQPGGVVFAAGKATVITTDPDFATYKFSSCAKTNTGGNVSPPLPYTSWSGLPNLDTTFYCADLGKGHRQYSGPLLPGNKGIEPILRDQGASVDYDTEVSLYNAYGYIDCCQSSIAEGGSAIYTNTDKFIGVSGNYNDYGYGGSLFGNSTVSQMGDPRTNNEQMAYHRITGITGDQSRYYNGNHTLGYHNGNYVQPVGGSIMPPHPPTVSGTTTNFIPWPDYYTWDNNLTTYNNPDQTTAPSVVADTALTSIGQLGDLFDPARIANTAGGSTPQVSRGGGRTFKIGQRDDRFTYDASTNPAPYDKSADGVSASNGWAAWRLADVFSVDTIINLPGRININGVLRDGGAAFRAALTGFSFQPTTASAGATSSDPNIHGARNLAGLPLNDDPTVQFGLTRIIKQMMARLKMSATPSATANTPYGPFFERGEFGELENTLDANGNAAGGSSLFGKNVTSPFVKSSELVNNQDMNRTFDRGREEVFRRLAELICTRGDTFTIYAVGQSLAQLPSQTPTTAPIKITGTHRLRVTFRLVPKPTVASATTDFHPGYSLKPGDGTVDKVFDFDPTSTSEVSQRFAKPDHYDVQILEVNTL